MNSDFIEELKWRGLLHDIIPGTKEKLNEEKIAAYIGFDPTADSLHIGSLVQIMLLVHLQRAGHKPIALVGGATGMIGDPSGKSEERNLLSEDILNHNVVCIENQLRKFLIFDGIENSAEIVNNYDWFKDFNILDFMRNIGKHLTVSYMLAKDSVKKRLETGISFTEFSYQLIQGYDFYWLWKNKGVKLQMGGSDQWGNITAGTELIRRIGGGEAYAFTAPLLTKPDGSKFGKSEGGNVWLDANRTSPYKFYQFWLNVPDEEAKKYILIFTLLSKEKIEALINEHDQTPHLRLLQKTLAEEITVRTHGVEEFNNAVNASSILFGNSTEDTLKTLNEKTLLSVFEGVPMPLISLNKLTKGVSIVEFLSDDTGIFASKSEVKRAIKENSISINKVKFSGDENYQITHNHLISNKFILVQRGKKNFYLVSFTQ